MADTAETSSTPSKPVIVRVKRKAFHSPLDAFWLEINERPLKRPLLDFEKLSIADSSAKIEELKTKRVFVQHVETLSNSKVNIDILQSIVPDAVNAVESTSKSEERRSTVKTKSKQDQLLVKAKKEQEVLSKGARFEQIWRRRKGTKEANHDEALYEMCHLYDVVRVDVMRKTEEVKEQEDTELEDHRIMSSFLPLLREFIPSAASEIESEIDDYMSKESKDDFVYDFYTVKDDITMTTEDASNPFPLVQVHDDDDFYDGPDESENESYDSNAEDNPMNEYPDEETSSDEEETESRISADISEEDKGSVASGDESSGAEGSEDHDFFEDEIYGVDDGKDYDYDDSDGDGDEHDD